MEETLQQIRYLDQQLQVTELNDAQQELVDSHRLACTMRRKGAFNKLGLKPTDVGEGATWDQHRNQVDEDLELQAQAERLQTEGLEAAWEVYQERERLKGVRHSLLASVAQPPAAAVPDAQQPQQLQLPDAGGATAPASVPQQQWQVPGWDGTATSNDPDHVEVMALDQLTAPAYDPAYAAAAAPATPQPQGPPPSPVNVPDGCKLCRRCHTVKPHSEFYRSKANSDGFDGRCKVCDAKQCVERRRKKQRIDNPTVEQKVCHKCGVEKAASDFYRNRTNNDGLYNNCKACFSANSAKRQQDLPPVEERMAAEKKCRRCEQVKPAADFYKNRLMLDGLYSHCKTCYQASAASRAAARNPVDTKECRRCGHMKPSSEFYKSKMTSNGLQSYCKYCYKITAAQSRVKKLEDEQASAAGQQNAALFQVHPGQLLAEHELQQQHAALQQPHPHHQQLLLPQHPAQHGMALPSSDAAAAVAEAAPPMSLSQPDALSPQAVAEAPPPVKPLPPDGNIAASGEVADSQARLQSLLEASGSQPQQLQQQHQPLHPGQQQTEHAPLLT